MPLEERRYKDNSQFGEGEEAKVCLDIMQRTGAHIELSLAKDQGLSIMVTGKLDSVMKARKEIVARLQTQVGRNDRSFRFHSAFPRRFTPTPPPPRGRLQRQSPSLKSTIALSSVRTARSCRSWS